MTKILFLEVGNDLEVPPRKTLMETLKMFLPWMVVMIMNYVRALNNGAKVRRRLIKELKEGTEYGRTQ